MKDQDLIQYFEKARLDFPILKEKIKGHNLIYADSAASSQKPEIVIKSIDEYYRKQYSNVHRGIHSLSEISTELYEEARRKVAKFINASENEIILTKGTTESINQIAFGISEQIQKGDEIILTEMEHHSNIVPWQELAKNKGATIKFLEINSDFRLDIKELENLISEKTKVIAITHISNVLGSINPIKEISKLAHENNILVAVDGAQAVPHMPVDVKELGCDFYSFSSHKMCGPTGVGILYGKKEELEKLKPLSYGGSMIYEVFKEKSTYADLPHRLEAGTPNIADIIAFSKTIDYLEELGMENVENYEKLLTKHFLEKIKEVKGITLYGPNSEEDRAAVFSINLKQIHPHDMSAILDKKGIAIRAGHHCAMPLMKKLEVAATSRFSFYFYNTLSEIDKCIEVLKEAQEEYEKGNFLL